MSKSRNELSFEGYHDITELFNTFNNYLASGNFIVSISVENMQFKEIVKRQDYIQLLDWIQKTFYVYVHRFKD